MATGAWPVHGAGKMDNRRVNGAHCVELLDESRGIRQIGDLAPEDVNTAHVRTGLQIFSIWFRPRFSGFIGTVNFP